MVITDPHIKADISNPVYVKANKAIFVQDCKHHHFVGNCWPGMSSWIDFFNKDAVDYWQKLYHPKRFVGTNELYDFWIDMNEPSVFDGEQVTMPYQNIHQNMVDFDSEDHVAIRHRDIHNAFGLLQS